MNDELILVLCADTVLWATVWEGAGVLASTGCMNAVNIAKPAGKTPAKQDPAAFEIAEAKQKAMQKEDKITG